MKYSHKRKIRKSWEKVVRNEIDLKKQKSYTNKITSNNYFKNYYKWETEWTLAETLDYTVTLVSFPEKLLPYIKVVPIIKTEEIYEKLDYLDEFTFSYNIIRTNEEEKTFNDYEIVVSLDVEQPENQHFPIYLKIVITLVNEQYFKEFKKYAWVRG